MCSTAQGFSMIYMVLLAIFLSMTLVSGVVQLFRAVVLEREKETDKKEITTAIIEIVVGSLALIAFAWLGLCFAVMLKALPLAVVLYVLWIIGARLVANRKKAEPADDSESSDAIASEDASESGEVAESADAMASEAAIASEDASESEAAISSGDASESEADETIDSGEDNAPGSDEDDASKSVQATVIALDNQRAKRIIPCLDVNEGRVVKGVNFVDLKDAGDPVEIAKAYNAAGADELVFLDITATTEARRTRIEMVKKVAGSITIPFAVGGGIRSKEDFAQVVKAGADKGSINSAAVERPELIKELAEEFGSERVVVAIDVKKREDGSGWNVYKNGGQVDTGLDALAWAKQAEKLGAGELLVTGMDCDGTKAGYDLEVTGRIAEAVKIPVIASGGAGKLEDFRDAFTIGKADAALAASLFHFKELEIQEVKKYLQKEGIPVTSA